MCNHKNHIISRGCSICPDCGEATFYRVSVETNSRQVFNAKNVNAIQKCHRLRKAETSPYSAAGTRLGSP